jgi:hypothetical protein
MSERTSKPGTELPPWAASVADPSELGARFWSRALVTPGSAAADGGSEPLLTKPITPWLASGAGNSWALTERFGAELPPIVRSSPPSSLVTTSMWPWNRTQSPGCGW